MYWTMKPGPARDAAKAAFEAEHAPAESTPEETMGLTIAQVTEIAREHCGPVATVEDQNLILSLAGQTESIPLRHVTRGTVKAAARILQTLLEQK